MAGTSSSRGAGRAGRRPPVRGIDDDDDPAPHTTLEALLYRQMTILGRVDRAFFRRPSGHSRTPLDPYRTVRTFRPDSR